MCLIFTILSYTSGRDGLTHNMLDNIHALWKRRRVCKIKCKGVCTVDMNNVCQQLEVGLLKLFCRMRFLCILILNAWVGFIWHNSSREPCGS